MRSLEAIRRANAEAQVREAFEANHAYGRRLTRDDALAAAELETGVEKASRRLAWLRHKAASKRRFWGARGHAY